MIHILLLRNLQRHGSSPRVRLPPLVEEIEALR